MQLDRLRAVPGAGSWLLVSIQGLHRFYRGRTEDVVASWMTRQDRELAIADNVAYVAAVVEAVEREFSIRETAVFAGFSQGVAMAFRAACSAPHPVAGVVALGGDLPPELDGARLAHVRAALVGRGLSDEWYGEPQWIADLARLRSAGVEARAAALDAGHVWTAAFSAEAGAFLEGVCR
jgi:predicted esterase